MAAFKRLKLKSPGIRGIANDWFKSYLSDRKQYVTIDGVNSSLIDMKHGVPQGSVLGPLLFLIYINDLNKAVHYSTTFHFADDTNLLNIARTPKKLQKQLNIDLKLLCGWLLANKISLNKSKTELIIFQQPWSEITFKFNIRLEGFKIPPGDQIKYLGTYLDKHLDGKYQTGIVLKKLIRATGMLAKARHYVKKDALKPIYFSTFHTHLDYGCLSWLQYKESIEIIHKMQKKALRIMSFADFQAHSAPLFQSWKILKIQEHLQLRSILFVYDYLKNNLPDCFDEFFSMQSDSHLLNTRLSETLALWIPFVNTSTYGFRTVSWRCLLTWNETLKSYPNLLSSSKESISRLLRKNYLRSYSIS